MESVLPWQLRAAFARRLSDMYGTEVPAYTTLLEVSGQVNQDVLAERGDGALRLGSIERVTAERHGAIRVGSPREMAQVARIFGAMGMFPVGFYDLREAIGSSIPVVSTAFRPIDKAELARNPFRVFTSMLTPGDRRFFAADMQTRLESFLDARVLFPAELLGLADQAEVDRCLEPADAEQFLRLAVAAFELSTEPVDLNWYRELEQISAVAADIGGVASTHINHLTPRVLDIDELYRRMADRGIQMIDEIQGPPAWEGPDVLLRQTSFRALAEPRAFRLADGTLEKSALRVRFGEVEARGIALTHAGRRIYDEMITEVQLRQTDGLDRAEVARAVWRENLPVTEHELAVSGLGFFEYTVGADLPPTPGPVDLSSLLESGRLIATPIVYEDFLPQSAAGIFASNLTSGGTKDLDQEAQTLDSDWLEGVLHRPLSDPTALYHLQQGRSLEAAAQTLGRSLPDPAK